MTNIKFNKESILEMLDKMCELAQLEENNKNPTMEIIITYKENKIKKTEKYRFWKEISDLYWIINNEYNEALESNIKNAKIIDIAIHLITKEV